MVGPTRTNRARPARWLLWIALGLATALAARAAWLALTHRVALVLVLGPAAWLVLASCVAAAPIAAWSLVDAARDRSPAPGTTSLRILFAVLVLAWLAFLTWVQPFQRLWFELSAGIAAGLACAGVLGLSRSRLPSSRTFRVAELSLFSLCASLVLAELGLRAVAAVHPMPILARAGDGPRQTIERFRCAPGTLRFGFPCNARGFYDEELHPLPAGQRWIASIGDSFSLGAVPHAFHYTSVAERELEIPIDNIGVAGIGPPEYLSLLVDEALPRGPDAIVIALFVGNDLVFESAAAARPHRWLRSWLERERVLLAVVPRRLSRLAGEREAAQARAQGEVFVAAPDSAAHGQALPWLDDPAREPPGLSSEAFLRLETARALDVCAGDPPSLPELFALLREARRIASPTPLHVLLIPDEFQVEDELWAAVQRRAGRPLERGRPQRLIGTWLEREAIAHLDLLPHLRAVTPLADGRRHVYHLRDTHFNARGNRVAGEALAEFLAGRR